MNSFSVPLPVSPPHPYRSATISDRMDAGDEELVVNAAGVIDRRASALHNLKTMGVEVAEALTPIPAIIAVAKRDPGPPAYKVARSLYYFLNGIAWWLLQLVTLPFALIKDGADVWTHATAPEPAPPAAPPRPKQPTRVAPDVAPPRPSAHVGVRSI